MRAVVLVTDSEAVRDFERALLDAGAGFTVIPTVWGGGRTGLRTGDRVHPGGCSLMFTIVPDPEVERMLVLLQQVRAQSPSAECTHIYVAAVEQVA